MADSLPQHARVLIVRLSALGDILFALETVASLKLERPDVVIDFLVEDRFASLLDRHPQIERVLVYPRREKIAIPAALRRLRQSRYDAVLDLHGILKSALHIAAARSGRKLGFAPPASREGAHRFYDRAVALHEPLPHRAERGLDLLRALGLVGAPARAVLAPPLEPPHFWHDDDRARIVLHPGTSTFAAFKRWPLPRFVELARRLEGHGAAVAVSVGPGERALADAILREVHSVRVLDGQALGLVGLAAVYGGAHLMVAADTGPLHLAAASGTRVLALFGPKDPALYGPRGAGHALLFADVPCRPCRLRWCPSPQCILGVHVNEVEETVLRLLKDD